MRRRILAALILLAGLLAGVGLIAWNVNPGCFGILVAMALSVPYTGRRKGFLADGAAFVAEVLLVEYVGLAAWLAAFVSGAPDLLGRESWFLRAQGILAVVMAVVVLATGVRLWLRPPMLALTQRGVARRLFFGTTVILWEELTEPITVRGATVKVGSGKRITLAGLRTDPAFIVSAIDYFRAHPQDRAAIGTFEGHRRLQEASVVVAR